MENQNQININAFNVHNEIVSLYKANQIVLEYDDATKKLMYLVDNIDNLSLQSVKYFIKKLTVTMWYPDFTNVVKTRVAMYVSPKYCLI